MFVSRKQELDRRFVGMEADEEVQGVRMLYKAAVQGVTAGSRTNSHG